MRLLRHETYRVMPWKNGGGITREIAIFPDGARAGDFLWRLSLATVSASGPFSRFEGVDRSIACISGGGMRLAFVDGHEALVLRGEAPLAFAGEDEIDAECLDGETVDFNAMTRRTSWRHVMRHAVVMEPTTVARTGDVTAILFAGAARITAGDETLDVRPLDCLILESVDARHTIEPSGRLELYAIAFEHLARTSTSD